MIQYDESIFRSECEAASTMMQAAVKLGIHYNTLVRIAKKLGCYKPNQGGRGTTKKSNGYEIPLEEILKGLHPSYQTIKLKMKLFKAGIKKNECENCNLNKWLGETISCELDHINGDRTDHVLSNLRILCPNCHSQTDTFRSKVRRSCGEIGSTREF